MLKRLLLGVVFGATLSVTAIAHGQQADWARLAAALWEGYKRSYIFCGANCGGDSGLVYDPSIGYLAPSEGVGYGLLMAVMMDDQPTFDRQYDAAHRLMLDPSTGLHHWRVDSAGTIEGATSATDAEQDIATALIFAQQRVESGRWTQHAERPYGERASALIDAIWTYEVSEGRYLKPGDDFGSGQDITNLSYFAPAWYRLYDAFQGTARWQGVIDQGYATLYATDGAALGLAPDWSTAEGRPAFDACQRISRPLDACGYDMRYDAIRVPWRIGLDCLWNGEPRACEWSRRSVAFLQRQPDSSFARMYRMDGQTVVDYQDESMLGMWLVTALAANDAAFQTRIEALILARAAHAEARGYVGDLPQYYFNQSLIWFGIALRSGDFQRIR
jgi:endo-1,4-beta-D-glucanase Y